MKIKQEKPPRFLEYLGISWNIRNILGGWLRGYTQKAENWSVCPWPRLQLGSWVCAEDEQTLLTPQWPPPLKATACRKWRKGEWTGMRVTWCNVFRMWFGMSLECAATSSVASANSAKNVALWMWLTDSLWLWLVAACCDFEFASPRSSKAMNM